MLASEMSCATDREMVKEASAGFMHASAPANVAPERKGRSGVPRDDQYPASFATKQEGLEKCPGAHHSSPSSGSCEPLSSAATSCEDYSEAQYAQHSPLDPQRHNETAPLCAHPAEEGKGSSAPGLYSCFACRNAKRLCDKRHPCGRCVRLDLTCVLQSRGRGRPSCKSKPRLTCRPRQPAPRAAPAPTPAPRLVSALPPPLQRHDGHFHAAHLPEPWSSLQQAELYASERRVRPRLEGAPWEGPIRGPVSALDEAAGQALLHRACQALLHLGTRSLNRPSEAAWRPLPQPQPPMAYQHYARQPSPSPFLHNNYTAPPQKQHDHSLYPWPQSMAARDVLLSLPRMAPAASEREWGPSEWATRRALAALPHYAWPHDNPPQHAAMHFNTHTHTHTHHLGQLPHGLRP